MESQSSRNEFYAFSASQYKAREYASKSSFGRSFANLIEAAYVDMLMKAPDYQQRGI